MVPTSCTPFFPPASAVEGIKSLPSVRLSVCPSVWVYSGYIIHHYNGIWGTCAPGRRNMHHQGALCTRETMFFEKFRGP